MPTRQYLCSTKNSYGFTLIELISVISLIGVTAAISAPSLLGFLARSKVNSGLAELRSMLQLTQRNAMRRSRSCAMLLPDNEIENGVLTSSCSITGSAVLDGIWIKYNRANSKKVNFSYRGHTNSTRTIVLYSNSTKHKRCVVISNGIGMMRSGVYTRNDLTSISATYCQTTRS